MQIKTIFLLSVLAIAVACQQISQQLSQQTSPSNKNNICEIFSEKRSWKRHARKSERKWGVPVPVLMATMRYESAFKSDVKTPRKKILGFIPSWQRVSSAQGYAQALDGTWKQYKKETGKFFVSRSSFADSIDFMGWYMHKSRKNLGISKHNAYAQYLAYHEGQGGYRRGTYHKKPWLKKYARKVSSLAGVYSIQYNSCN